MCLHIILKAVYWKSPFSFERRLTFRNKLQLQARIDEKQNALKILFENLKET
jgi:hypothetical protein